MTSLHTGGSGRQVDPPARASAWSDLTSSPGLLSELDTKSGGPLQGVRVLDLSRIVAAPFATMALGELGATVIKVERAGAGDDCRAWGPPFVDGESAYFLSVNRNKRGMTIDFATEEGRSVVRQLALEWADVVVENFKDGTLEGWGLDLADLRRSNSRLVTASVRGYPEGDSRPGYDFITQASSGLMSLNGPVDGDFYKVGIPISDLSSALYLLSGILAALWHRQQTGSGQHVSVSLWESQVSLLVNANQAYLATHQSPRRLGNAHPQVAPYEVYRTKDAPVAIAGANQAQFARIAESLGHPEWVEDPAFASNADRVTNRAELAARIEAVLATRERDDVLAMLTAAGVPCGPLRTVDEVLTSPEAEASGIVAAVTHELLGEVPVIRLPWRFSDTPAEPRFGPPTLGQDTDAILSALAEVGVHAGGRSESERDGVLAPDTEHRT